MWSGCEDYYNNVGTSAFVSFAWMQIIRLIQTVILFFTWILSIYINMRKSIIYINFWALTFTFAAFLTLFMSSGKQKVQKTLYIDK